MDDLTCHVCAALVTPLGQSDGVFCGRGGCPGDRLSHGDVGERCEAAPFCLNFSGESVAVLTGSTATPTEAAAQLPKRRRAAVPLRQPTLFD